MGETHLRRFSFSECIEQLRSRFVTIKSDFRFISQEIEMISQKYQDRKQMPPLIFPKRLIDIFEKYCEQIERRFLYLILLHNGNYFVQALREIQIINVHINSLIHSLRALEGIINQRIKGLNIGNILISPSPLFQILDYHKIYHAIDALCYNLFETIMGIRWIRGRSFFPLVFFGSRYAVLLPLNIVEIPSYDLCRNRFWANVAHEIAHIKIYEKRKTRLFTRLKEDFASTISSFPIGINNERAHSQFIELLSDAIGVYVCGPSALLSSLSIMPPELPIYETPDAQIMEDGDAIDALRYYSHPPSDIRFLVMNEILKLNGIEEKWMNPVDQISKKRLDERSGHWRFEYFLTLQKIYSRNYIEEVYSMIEKFCGKRAKYEKDEWDEAKNLYQRIKTGKKIDATPIQIINTIWVARKDTFKRTKITKLFLKRLYEGKYFESSIERMCEWYSKK